MFIYLTGSLIRSVWQEVINHLDTIEKWNKLDSSMCYLLRAEQSFFLFLFFPQQKRGLEKKKSVRCQRNHCNELCCCYVRGKSLFWGCEIILVSKVLQAGSPVCEPAVLSKSWINTLQTVNWLPLATHYVICQKQTDFDSRPCCRWD